MKKLYTLLFITLFVYNSSSQTSFCDNFDSYTNLNLQIATSSIHWNTWGELMTGANPSLDDAFMSNNQSLLTSATVTPVDHEPLLIIPDNFVLSSN